MVNHLSLFAILNYYSIWNDLPSIKSGTLPSCLCCEATRTHAEVFNIEKVFAGQGGTLPLSMPQGPSHSYMNPITVL